jgi:hypothetical protein
MEGHLIIVLFIKIIANILIIVIKLSKVLQIKTWIYKEGDLWLSSFRKRRQFINQVF